MLIVLAAPVGSGLYGWVRDSDLSDMGSSMTEGVRSSRVPENSVRPSSGINVAAVIRFERTLGPGHVVVTILCDGGARYQSKLFNAEFLRGRGLPVPAWIG